MKIIKALLKFVFRLIMRLFLLCLAGIIACVFINFYVQTSVKDQIVSMDQAENFQGDCILVLGAGVFGNQPSAMLEDRIKTGVELYNRGASNRLLMSGDHGSKDYDEVNVMKKFAVNEGVPSGHIFMDHAGFSTYDSLYRAKDVFLAKKIVIVTQKYHLYRALYIAKGLGLEAIGVSADIRVYAGQEWRDFREVLARIKDFIYILLKPYPEFLGEPIPVWGDGDLTNG